MKYLSPKSTIFNLDQYEGKEIRHHLYLMSHWSSEAWLGKPYHGFSKGNFSSAISSRDRNLRDIPGRCYFLVDTVCFPKLPYPRSSLLPGIDMKLFLGVWLPAFSVWSSKSHQSTSTVSSPSASSAWPKRQNSGQAGPRSQFIYEWKRGCVICLCLGRP